MKKCEDAVSIIRAVEDIIKIKEKNMIFVAYGQGLIFNRFKENTAL